VNLLGEQLSRAEVLDRVGDVGQLGGAEPAVLTDGTSAGVRVIQVRSAGGLSFTVIADRALDIGTADYCGVPLAWRSPVGVAHPAFTPGTDRGWLDTFGGGLVTTCGLATVGQPSQDGADRLGLHGRISSVPAGSVRSGGGWVGDEYVVTVSGRVREASALGAVLQLERRITTRVGQPTLRVDDIVTNVGRTRTPHMFRYHCNLGYPLLSSETTADLKTQSVEARDTFQDRPSTQSTEDLTRFTGPTEGADESVHTVTPSGTGAWAQAVMTNPRLLGGMSLTLRWTRRTLPWLVVWKQLAAGTYVTALEPSTGHDEGRRAERARGTPLDLKPNEQRRYALEITVRATSTPATDRPVSRPVRRTLEGAGDAVR